MFLRLIHIVARYQELVSFHCFISSYSLDWIRHNYICSPLVGHLNCFHLGDSYEQSCCEEVPLVGLCFVNSTQIFLFFHTDLFCAWMLHSQIQFFFFFWILRKPEVQAYLCFLAGHVYYKPHTMPGVLLGYLILHNTFMWYLSSLSHDTCKIGPAHWRSWSKVKQKASPRGIRPGTEAPPKGWPPSHRPNPSLGNKLGMSDGPRNQYPSRPWPQCCLASFGQKLLDQGSREY